jgi:malyl-CoA/(S)-citramalyl-CoA lyase
VRHPRDYERPLAAGAPSPLLTPAPHPLRVIHFIDPANPRMRARAADLAAQADVLIGNLEDGIPIDRKEEARRGLLTLATDRGRRGTPLWARINGLDNHWALRDLAAIVAGAGEEIEVIMVPKVEAADDIHYLDRLLAQLEAEHRISRPIGLHAIIENPLGVTNVEEIANASPRMRGLSFGPADLAAARGMKTTRAGGGHPGYQVLADGSGTAARELTQQDLWHYSLARLVDACRAAGIDPLYGPYGDLYDDLGCETQFRSAWTMGCVGGWSVHPRQIPIALRVFGESAPG